MAFTRTVSKSGVKLLVVQFLAPRSVRSAVSLGLLAWVNMTIFVQENRKLYQMSLSSVRFLRWKLVELRKQEFIFVFPHPCFSLMEVS
jgi:hypothetical protein